MEPNRTTLEVKEVFPEDSGTYTVIARNLGGEARTSCLVSVEPLQPVRQEPLTSAPVKPHFTRPLKNLDVMEGSRARLDTEVVARPEPEVRYQSPCLAPQEVFPHMAFI